MAATPTVKCDPIDGSTARLQQATISDCITDLVLVANTPQSASIPAGSRFAQVVSELTVWVRKDADPTIPVASRTGSEAVLVPAGSGRLIRVDGATTLRAVSASAGICSLEFLA